MKTKNKIILIIILSVFASYLVKTNKPGDKNSTVEKVEIKSEPKKNFTKEEPEFWIENLENKNDILMSREKIEEYNNKSFSKVDVLMDLWGHNPSIEKQELVSLINSISSIPKEERYKSDGNIMDKDYYKMLIDNLNLDSIKDTNNINYGITTDRTNFRTFPTYEASYRKQGDSQFDRFQETAVYPLEPLIIYTESKDGEWYFARMYNYVAWVPKDNIILGEKEEIFDFINNEKFLVTIGRQISIEDRTFDMGTKIPLKEEKEIHTLY